MSRMLLCETQEDLASAIQEYFCGDDYSVIRETNGLRILEILRHEEIDVAIIVTALPGLDGLSVLRSFRSSGGKTPILLLSGQGSPEQMQVALDAGADAYLAKPFRLSDLAAQLRAMLRRPSIRTAGVLALGNIALDSDAGKVTKGDDEIHLYPMEFKLLQFLMRHPNQVFSAHALFERVWQKGESSVDDTVRTHIRTLRKKIDSAGKRSIITTVRGLGYKAELS